MAVNEESAEAGRTVPDPCLPRRGGTCPRGPVVYRDAVWPPVAGRLIGG